MLDSNAQEFAGGLELFGDAGAVFVGTVALRAQWVMVGDDYGEVAANSRPTYSTTITGEVELTIMSDTSISNSLVIFTTCFSVA